MKKFSQDLVRVFAAIKFKKYLKLFGAKSEIEIKAEPTKYLQQNTQPPKIINLSLDKILEILKLQSVNPEAGTALLEEQKGLNDRNLALLKNVKSTSEITRF